MQRVLVVLLTIAFLLTLVACGGGSQQTPTPTPTPTTSSESPKPTPTTSSETPKPTPTTSSETPKPTPTTSSETPKPTPTESSNIGVEIQPYPGAEKQSESKFQGSSPNGNEGDVIVTTYTSKDPFDQIKAYYEGALPSGLKEDYSNEYTDDNGNRTLALSASSQDGKIWAAVTINENSQEDGSSMISQTVGTEGSGQSTAAETGKVTPYANANFTSISSFSGTGITGGEGTWSVVTLETTDDYQTVANYYENLNLSGFQQTYNGETSDDNGARTFSRWMASGANDEWYVISVTENKDDNKVEISQMYGHQ
jgi:hypothetical protein